MESFSDERSLSISLNMAKTITISNRAYEAFSKEKREGESFSDVILRLTSSKNKEKIMKFA